MAHTGTKIKQGDKEISVTQKQASLWGKHIREEAMSPSERQELSALLVKMDLEGLVTDRAEVLKRQKPIVRQELGLRNAFA